MISAIPLALPFSLLYLSQLALTDCDTHPYLCCFPRSYALDLPKKDTIAVDDVLQLHADVVQGILFGCECGYWGEPGHVYFGFMLGWSIDWFTLPLTLGPS